MNGRHLWGTLGALTALAITLAPAVAAGAASYRANGYAIEVHTSGDQTRVGYHVTVTDPAGTPAGDTLLALTGRVNGAEYRVSGDPGQLEVRAMLKPGSRPGEHTGEIAYPEKGIWKMQLAVVQPGPQKVLAQVEFDESIGGVWRDEARGATMLGALGAVIVLYYLASIRRRITAIRK